jgi:hypothetical protein
LWLLALNFTPTIEEAPNIRQENKTTKVKKETVIVLYNISLRIEPQPLFLLQQNKSACLVVGMDPKDASIERHKPFKEKS